METQKLKT